MVPVEFVRCGTRRILIAFSLLPRERQPIFRKCEGPEGPPISEEEGKKGRLQAVEVNGGG